MKTGIYIIKNIVNRKFYIGSASVSFTKRKGSHFRRLKNQKHHSPYLQKAWNKYGEENFEFAILEYVLPEKCIEREQWYLDNLKPEYNHCKIANSRLGCKHTEATKLKMSISRMGENNPHFGKSHSLQTKALLSKKFLKSQSSRAKRVYVKNKITGEQIIFSCLVDCSNFFKINRNSLCLSMCKYRKLRKDLQNWEFSYDTTNRQ